MDHLVINRQSTLWAYLSDDLRALIEVGEQLILHAQHHEKDVASDYSYLVFAFAKAYEGFLKKLLLDIEIIREDQYYGDDMRIGRILNPHFKKENENIFDKLCKSENTGEELSLRMWNIWKRGRNQVFHYFPHNFRRLDEQEALDIIKEIVSTMEQAVGTCKLS